MFFDSAYEIAIAAHAVKPWYQATLMHKEINEAGFQFVFLYKYTLLLK